MNTLLQSKFINGWGLVLLFAVPISILVLNQLPAHDLSTGEGVSAMIGFSVRLAVPFIYLVLAASAVHTLWPGSFTRWWMRNRKYLGLIFAVAMAWQGVFIFTMSNFFNAYYYEEVYLLRDELEGSIGYIFLAFMVVTSFHFGRRHLSQAQWKVLHRGGVYFMWMYPFSVYWWNLSYYPDPITMDYFYYWGGFIAFALRIVAWGKRRQKAADKVGRVRVSLLSRAVGSIFVAAGLVLASVGLNWQEAMTGFLTAPQWSAQLVLWLPFWPFEPFWSLVLIGIGTNLITPSNRPEPLIGEAAGSRVSTH